jgi:hypothetical protein
MIVCGEVDFTAKTLQDFDGKEINELLSKLVEIDLPTQ